MDDFSELALARRQLQAIRSWHRDRWAAEQEVRQGAGSRELRMDVDRQLEVLRAQHEAIVALTHRALEHSGHPLQSRLPRRLLVAHRHAWFVGRLTGRLREAGVELVAHVENGAQAVGAAVAEQPDLVVVEDRLAMLGGEQVVREVRRYLPTAVVAAQVAYEDEVPRMLEAGATAAYSRRVPPAEVADEVLLLLTREHQPA